MKQSASYRILTLLIASPGGLSTREISHVLPADYCPSASPSTATAVKLNWLMSAGYVTRSETRVVVRETTYKAVDNGGGYLWYVTSLGRKWHAAGCPQPFRRKPSAFREAKEERVMRSLLVHLAGMLTAKACDLGYHTPVADRPAAVAMLTDKGLNIAQTSRIFGVSRERARQYLLMYRGEL